MAPFLRNVSDDQTDQLEAAVAAANLKPFFRAEPLTLDAPTWIMTKRMFREHETLANELEGKGIVLIDLAYNRIRVTDPKLYLNRDLFEIVRAAVTEAGVEVPRLCLGGLYLGCLALSNTKWRGLVCIASVQMAVDTTQRVMNRLAATLRIDLSERRLIVLGTGVRTAPVRVIGDAAQAYVDAFGGLLERLCPPHTENWFRIADGWERPNNVPPHKYDADLEPGYAAEFTAYLAGLWRLPAHEVQDWWGGRQTDDKEWCHDSLKRVTGHVACADPRESGAYYGPSVGTLAILAAASCPQPMQWLRGVCWSNLATCPQTTYGVVEETKRSLAVVQSFGAFADDIFVEQKDKDKKSTTITSVEIAGGQVTFVVNFPLETAVRRDPPHSAGRLLRSFEDSLGRRLDVSGARLVVGYPG